MTQSVTFQFSSAQFTFDSGRILFSKGARLSSDGEMSLGKIDSGTVVGVLVEGPIEFDARLQLLKVTRRSDHRQFEIRTLFVSGLMTDENLRARLVVVDLYLPLLLIFRVEDSKGLTVPNAHVGMSFPNTEATSETTTNATGEIILFGTPGRYHVGVSAIGDRWLGNDRIFVNFEVQPEESGERVILLTVP